MQAAVALARPTVPIETETRYLQHAERFVTVEGMHDLGRIPLVERINPVRARRMGFTPVSQIAPLVVDPADKPVLLAPTRLAARRLLLAPLHGGRLGEVPRRV